MVAGERIPCTQHSCSHAEVSLGYLAALKSVTIKPRGQYRGDVPKPRACVPPGCHPQHPRDKCTCRISDLKMTPTIPGCHPALVIKSTTLLSCGGPGPPSTRTQSRPGAQQPLRAAPRVPRLLCLSTPHNVPGFSKMQESRAASVFLNQISHT